LTARNNLPLDFLVSLLPNLQTLCAALNGGLGFRFLTPGSLPRLRRVCITERNNWLTMDPSMAKRVFPAGQDSLESVDLHMCDPWRMYADDRPRHALNYMEVYWEMASEPDDSEHDSEHCGGRGEAEEGEEGTQPQEEQEQNQGQGQEQPQPTAAAPPNLALLPYGIDDCPINYR
jgi:hypothetical protein